MYALSLIAWWIPIVIMIYLAYRMHLLTREQADAHEPYRGKKTAVLMDHRGIIGGDIVIVSPLCAWVMTYYMSNWKGWAIGVAAAIAFACSALMIYLWAKSSKENELIETFNFLGKTTNNGWVHGTYMFVAITVITLSLFFTPTMSTTFVWVMIVGLGIHITVGLIQPEYHTYRRVCKKTKAVVIVVWVVLLGRGLFIVN
jgi:hypothetical protein